MKCEITRKTLAVTEYQIKEEETNKSFNLYYNNMLMLCLPADSVVLKCVESNVTKQPLYVCIYKNNKYIGLCGYVTSIKIENM